MAGSLNKVMLIGNVGKDPEIRTSQDGTKLATLTLATSETWRDKQSGERKDRTEWHRVVIFNDKLADIAERYVKKGSRIFIEGQLQTRKWTNKEGQDQYSTEVVLQGFSSTLTMLDGKGDGEGRASSGGDYQGGNASYNQASPQRARVAETELDDEIPF
jgi:single-strand DNA-binding protein